MNIPTNGLGSLLLAVSAIIAGLSSVGSGQCLPRDAGNLPQWAVGSTQSWNIDTNITNSSQINQIEAGIAGWNISNSTYNCSAVEFEGETSSGETILFKNNTSVDAAARLSNAIAFGDELEYVEIHFNPNFEVATGAFYDPNFNPSNASPHPYSTVFNKITMHELGHTMGLSHYTSGYSGCSQSQGSSVMNSGCGRNDYFQGGYIAESVTACDISTLTTIYCAPTPTPTATPTPTPTPEPCPLDCDPEDPEEGLPNPPTQWTEIEPVDWCTYPFPTNNGCPPGLFRYRQSSKCCWNSTPVVIDVEGDGIDLTDAENGVSFDINNDGFMDNISWTASGVDDAWLVFDTNGNGTIDSGHELFGNFTPQPNPPSGEARNGFLALAEFDKLFSGGNGDGFISRRDSVYPHLRLWQDLNHNGLSEPGELLTVNQTGLRKIYLDYRESRRVDQHGNRFVYRTKVKDSQDAQLGRWAWDVVLLGR